MDYLWRAADDEGTVLDVVVQKNGIRKPQPDDLGSA